MVFLLSEYHARKVVKGTERMGNLESGKLARIIHPLNAASNTHFFVSVSKARKETLLDFAPAQGNAKAAFHFIKKYRFTFIFFAGRPNPPITYFRKKD